MTLRRSAMASMGLAALASSAACNRERQPIRIGLGYPSHRAAHFARAVAESLVSRDGRPIRIELDSLRVEPGISFQAAEVRHASRLTAQRDMIGVVGHGGSREALMTAPIYNEAHQSFILATATSRRLRTTGPWTFTIAPDDSIEGEFIGRFVAERLAARRVTVFYVVDEYGTGLRDGVIAALQPRGVAVLDAVPVALTAPCAPTRASNDYAAIVDAALLRGRPDAVILATRQLEAGCILAQLQRRTPGLPVVGGDGVLVDRLLLERAGRMADSLYVAAFWHPDRPDSLSRDFVRRFQNHFPNSVPDYTDAMIYDALMTFVAALQAVGSDRERVRRYLASLGREVPPLPGVAGLITFPARPDRLVMTQVRGGAIVLVPSP